MNKYKITISILAIALLPAISLALTYVALEPQAFPDMNSSGSTQMGPFLASVFNFGIAIAAALAVVMIAWGGIQYMTTDAWFGKEDAKEKIWNAILGLLLALVSWLILYIINPNIFSNNNSFISGNAPASTQSTNQ